MREGIARRLARVRDTHGLSLREMQQVLTEHGYPCSHDSIRHYEKGSRTIPVDYVHAVCVSFHQDPAWLLLGPPTSGEDRNAVGVARPADWASEVAALRRRWQEAVAELPVVAGRVPSVLVPDAPIETPEPADEAQLPARPPPESFQASRLIRAARPHMRWISARHTGVEHVVYLTDPDGVVSSIESDSPEAMASQSLFPGQDRSRGHPEMCGPLEALREGRPVAAIGTDLPTADNSWSVSLAAPIFGEPDSPIGVLDLWTPLVHADAHRLALVAYAGVAIGFDLQGRRPGGILPRPERSTDEPAPPPEASERDALPPESEDL